MRAVVSFSVVWLLISGYSFGQLQSRFEKVLEILGLKRGSTVNCYEDLGCFEHIAPWYSLTRPFPAPMNRTAIGTKLRLYSSVNPMISDKVNLHGQIYIEGSNFNPNRPYTVIIVHGFASSGYVAWVHELKNTYLKKRDANIFITDWSSGASQWNYLQVAANARIVGEELKRYKTKLYSENSNPRTTMFRFGKYLIQERNVNPSHIHLIGHCLGAHVLAYVGKAIPGIGQLTALDPTQPGFEGFPNEVVLRKGDADFIDVVHTDSNPFIPLLGFGMTLPTGDVDFYINGGLFQPQCVIPPTTDKIQIFSIKSLEMYSVELLSHYISCSHDKAYAYYIESLDNDYCIFWGRAGGVVGTAMDLVSFGLWDSIAEYLYGCTLDTCSPMGMETKYYPGRGVFSVSTHTTSPYCASNPKITRSMLEQRAALAKHDKRRSNDENRRGLKVMIKRFIQTVFFGDEHSEDKT